MGSEIKTKQTGFEKNWERTGRMIGEMKAARGAYWLKTAAVVYGRQR